MKVSILIVSYLRDKRWLVHCLNSIHKFARGFHDIKLLWPEQERDGVAGIPAVKVIYYRRHDNPRLWHLDHQRMKCHADELCPDADVVFHIDSDTFFTGTITPEDTCPGGKPMLVIGSYEAIKAQGIDIPWKPVVDFCMGGDNLYETIRLPHPCYWLGIYKDVRDQIAKLHHQDFDEFVLAQRPDFPWGFTENNMLGTMCLTPKWRDKYHVVNVDTDGWPKIKVAHFWSHSPPDKPQRAQDTGVDARFINAQGWVVPQDVYDHYGI